MRVEAYLEMKAQATLRLGNDSRLKGNLRPESERESDWGAYVPCEHDVAFRIAGTQTVLFAEPDDASKAALSVARYLVWMEKNHVRTRIHLIHPIESGTGDSCFLAYYLGYRIESMHRNFVYHPFRVQEWDSEAWISDLLAVARQIVSQDLLETRPQMNIEEEGKTSTFNSRDRGHCRTSASLPRTEPGPGSQRP